MSSSASSSKISFPLIILNGTNGLEVLEGEHPFDDLLIVGEEKDKRVKCFDISQNGQYVAYATANHQIRVVSLPDFKIVFEKDNTPVTSLVLSPKANVLAIWNFPSQTNQSNLKLFGVFSDQLLNSFFQKRQHRWWPHWSPDESVCVIHFNAELHFFENNLFDSYKRKLFSQKVTCFSMTTNKQNGKHYIACYSAGSKGQPNYARVYQYPKFENLGLANKSLYKADYVEFIWNFKGDALLLHCTCDIDKSGKSYYGEHTLHYLDVKGNTFIVTLKKPGPIHSVVWMPSIKESLFCVIYGLVPAKTSLFNSKSEIVFDFDESMVNLISFNPQGNLLALAGFGNLRGGIQIWDIKKKKMISKFMAAETTSMEWCPDGMHILTATTSPRLRVGNKFIIWSYNGNEIFKKEFGTDIELWDIKWQPNDKFPEPQIKDLPAIKPTAKQADEPPKYVPPHLRKAGMAKPKESAVKVTPMTSDDADKKMKNLSKKLEQIEKLKEIKSSGKKMEKNQLEKIEKEQEIIEEITKLKFNMTMNKSDWNE